MNNKAIIPILAVLVVAAAGAFWWLNKPAKSLDLYKYYPKDTAFYVEVAPGEERVTQVLDFVEAQADNQAAMAADMGGGAEAAMLQSSMNKALAVNKQRQREQLKKVVENFNSTFEPDFSIGAWMPAGNAAATPDQGDALVVFALRKDMTLEELAQRFELKLDEFDKKEFKGDKAIAYLVDKQERFAYAIADQKFMVTNNEDAMTRALTHYAKHEPNVYDDPVNKEYVDMLSAKREGTFLLNNRIYGETAKKMREQMAGGHSPIKEDVMEAMADAVPVTVGAIELDTENQMSVHFISPIMAENVKDEALRTAMQNLYANQQPLDDAKLLPENTAFYLAVVGIDNIYDFYTQHLLDKEALGQMGMVQMMLSSSGLELRKDVVGLFADKTVLAGRPQDQSMLLVLDKNDQKMATLQKVNQMLQQMVQPKSDTIENVAVTMVPMPNGNTMSELAFGEVNDNIMFALSNDFAEAVKVGKGQAGNLGQNATFQALMRDMPKQGNFMMYLNLADMPNPGNQPKPVEAMSFGMWSGKKGQADLIEGQLNVLFPKQEAAKKAS